MKRTVVGIVIGIMISDLWELSANSICDKSLERGLFTWD